jgi:hypothetical protein
MPPPPRAVSGDHRSILRAIVDPEVNLAIWRRRPLRRIEPFLRRLLHDGLEESEFSTDCSFPTPVLRDNLAKRLPGSGRDHRDWIFDLAALAQLLGVLAAVSRVQVRVEPVRGRACHLHHADMVTLRLLTTYVGPGTEWVPETSLDRGQLCQGSNQGVVRGGPAAVRRLPTGAVGIFKGERHPGNRGLGCVHRSPDSRGHPRLLVAIDPLD